MKESETNLCSYEARVWPWRYTFILTRESIIKRWTDPLDSNAGETRYPISTLTPNLSQSRQFANEAQPHLKRGALLLACTVCFYFSDFNKSIPLLAPFLAVPGLVLFTRGLIRLRQYAWTVIEGKQGTNVVYIPYDPRCATQREHFEEAFTNLMNDRQTISANKALQGDGADAPRAER